MNGMHCGCKTTHVGVIHSSNPENQTAPQSWGTIDFDLVDVIWRINAEGVRARDLTHTVTTSSLGWPANVSSATFMYSANYMYRFSAAQRQSNGMGWRSRPISTIPRPRLPGGG
jgi:hypothetical protein